MATISGRLSALEANAGRAGAKRYYCVVGGSESYDAESFIRSQGYALHGDDTVLLIVGWLPNEDGPQPWKTGGLAWCGGLPPDEWRTPA
jgi:hypothetical protein